jgi:hypothetical protein
MRSITLISVLAFVSSAFAQTPTSSFDILSSPTDGTSYAVGDLLPMVWEPGTITDTISLILLGGPTVTDLSPIMVIARKASTRPFYCSSYSIPTNTDSPAALANHFGNYAWTIPPEVGTFAIYTVNLTDSTNTTLFQYSYPFHLTGGSAVGSGTSTGALTASTTPTTTGSSSSSTSAGPASTSSKAAAATKKVLSGGFTVLSGLALALVF